jgi:hypothetical protein
MKRVSTDKLLRQLAEAKSAWIMYVRGAMRPRATTIAGLEKKMERIRAELRARNYDWSG